ncbi:MAG: cadherin repeat domain-containing protein [Planctomycetaceae bacterium]|nr:cadherin repeat domain-containing protein [Planctomycetaceae bacterium]
MNQRERVLAIAVGCLTLVLALWFGWTYVEGQFRARRLRIDALGREIAGFRRQVMQSQTAARKLSEYEARSLPPNPEVAKSLYQDWLLKEIKAVGFVEPQVRALPSQKEGELYVKHTFDVSGKASLRQTVDLLHSIYSTDYLHRITSLIIKPVKDSRQLDVTIKIDAVSMATAPEASALHKQPSKRLDLASKEEYYKAILGRNLFGPQNQEPKLTVDGSKDLSINRPTSLAVKGTDPDPDDKVSYRLIELPSPEAKFDEKTGKLIWTPNKLGKYKLVVEAVDNGYPQKLDREEIALNVVDAREPPPRAGFDAAKFTVLSGVTEVDGEGEVWLHNRTKGQMLKLRVGDEFEIGSMKGVIESIGLTDFTFVSDGKLRRLAIRGTLSEAAEERAAGDTEETLPPG